MRLQGLGPFSPELGSGSLREITLGSEKANNIRFRDKIVGKFSLTSGFILGLLQICLGLFQIEVELNLFLLQVRKTSSEFTRFL